MGFLIAAEALFNIDDEFCDVNPNHNFLFAELT